MNKVRYLRTLKYALGSMVLLFGMDGMAAEPVNYWPGFKGRVHKFDAPLYAERPEDRYLKLKIRLPKNPDALRHDFESAFRNACLHHQRDLLRTARTLNADGDWRVKITFDWLISETKKAFGSVARTGHEQMELDLDDCRLG